MSGWESWVEKARRFASYAEEDYSRGRYDSASFYAQQAAETMLKGILIKNTGTRPYTHSLTDLLTSLARVKELEIPQEVMRCAEELEQHYLQSRYPDSRLNEYRPWEAERALECMRRVLAYAERLG